MELKFTDGDLLPKHTSSPLREHLLRATLMHCVENVPFYRDLFSCFLDPSSANLKSLLNLPVCSKTMLAAAGSSRFSRTGFVDKVQNTSGTTGAFLVSYRSIEEQLAIDRFFQTVRKSIGDDEMSEPKISLLLHLPTHGQVTGIPSNIFPIMHCIVDQNSAENCVHLLQQTFETNEVKGNITEISGSVGQISLLAAYLVENDLFIDEIEQVNVTGDFLTRFRREAIAKAFPRSCVSNTLSCSEILFGGSFCGSSIDLSGQISFDPLSVPEFTSADGKQNIEHGFCHLLNTGLFPFSQKSMFIRYITGDLFFVDVERNIYSFRGRTSCSVDLGRTSPSRSGWLDHSLALSSLLETCDIDSFSVPQYGFSGHGYQSLGLPQYVFVVNSGKIELHLLIGSDKRQCSPAIERIQDTIEQKISLVPYSSNAEFTETVLKRTKNMSVVYQS